jgi:hypothetical protein
MLSDTWLPYQKASFVTPSFPGYISGHSTFSRSAAEVLAAVTGSAFFPGGLGSFTAPSNTFLKFENGPSQTVQLQWATYFDASDQAGLSRLWGGIHVSVDDLTGRVVGSQCGQNVWTLAKAYFDGSVATTPAVLAVQVSPSGGSILRFNTLRGLFYGLQSTSDLSQPFTNEPAGLAQAIDSSLTLTNGSGGSQKFYRVVSSLTP